jgi:glyoxylase-like metal-dependent hydrolase (beta-lactamase superfamily II)
MTASRLRFCRQTNGVSNFYLVEEAGKVTLVDAGTPADWPRMLAALQRIGLGLDAVDCILLTHAHSDHTGFAEQARSEAGAAIWVHESDRGAAQGDAAQTHEAGIGRYLLRLETYRTIIGLARNRGVRLVPIAELRTFADDEVVDVPGKPRVVHNPGHTDGSCSIHFDRAGWLMTGDALVELNPLTGRRGAQVMPAALNYDSQQALDSLARLEATGARVVLPGHGNPLRDGAAAAVAAARAAGPS